MPPANSTMRPFSKCRCAAADIGLGNAVHADGRQKAGLTAHRLQGVLEGQAVHDRGEHAHVMRGRLDDPGVTGGELSAAEDVSAAEHDGDLRPVFRGAVSLRGQVQHGIHGDASLAPMREPIA